VQLNNCIINFFIFLEIAEWFVNMILGGEYSLELMCKSCLDFDRISLSFERNINDLTLQSLDWTGHHLIEDVVGTLEGLLRDDTSLFQQICMSEENIILDTLRKEI